MITGSLVITQVLNGLVLGCMYAIVASGLTLIWGTMKMLNFAHGEYYMIGGYICYFSIHLLGIHPILSIFIAFGLAYLAGVITEKGVIQPLLEKPNWEISAIVATIGISISLQNLALKVFGEHYKNIPYFFEGTFELFGIRLAYQRLFIIVVTAMTILGFWLVMKKTKFGFGLRATAQDRDAAVLMGINTKKVFRVTFGLSCGMAALAATLLAPIFSVNPWMGSAALLKGMITVVLGGLGNFGGAILAGIILGTIESMAVIVFSSEWKDVVAFIVFILVLTLRPSGLFGTREW